MNANNVPRVALVAGANGLIGSRVAAHLAARGWEVVALSRKPYGGSGVRQVAVDLTDARDARARLAAAGDTTHLFYCVRADHPEGVPESVDLNAAMLRNLVEALDDCAPRLVHIHLVHGTKHYGHHLGPCAVPAVEEGPRGPGGTYYFAQQDYLTARAARARWTWSIVRPHAFCFVDEGNPRSLALVIGVLAAVQRELGQPLFFPGNAKAHEARTQFTDLGLLSRSIEWMATAAQCGNQAFNIVNGDYPRWSELWPQLASQLGLEAGPPAGVKLGRYMADKARVWDAVVARHGLKAGALHRIVLWNYGDYAFTPEWDIMSSMDKARRLGFDERVDTPAMFGQLFQGYRSQGAIP